MKAICVDSDETTLDLAVSVCEDESLLTEVKRFTRAHDALAWLEEEVVNLAVLAVELPDVSGLLLASEIKRKYPAAAVVTILRWESLPGMVSLTGRVGSAAPVTRIAA